MNVSYSTRSSFDFDAPARHQGGLLAIAATLLALVFGLAPAAASAAEINWFAGNGTWSTASNWWPNTIPQHGDVVWVKSASGNLLVSYASTTGPWLKTFHVDSTNTATDTASFFLGRDLLNVGQQNVGVFGRGVFWSRGGTHQVTDLNLGFWAGSEGIYLLQNSGNLIANKVFVGMGAAGEFRHAAGSAAIAADLTVGFLNGAVGTYLLSGTAALSSGNIFVGSAGDGTFIHSDVGYTIPGDLTLGVFASGDGHYELGNGGSIATNRLFVGSGGRGTFLHDGGAVSAVGDISLGVLGGSAGTYELTSGGTITSNRLFVGGWGQGTFIHEDGDVDVAGDITLGLFGGSAGAYDLHPAGTVESLNMFVGGAAWGQFTQHGGATTIHGDLVVGNLGGTNGTYNLLDGSLTANRQYVGSFGIGKIEHSAGTNDINDLLQIGLWGSGWGRYTLSGTGQLEVGTLVLGGFGTGHFVQSGGDAVVIGGVRIAELLNSYSTLKLSGGTFAAGGIWNKIHGVLEFTGGELATPTIVNDGRFELGGEGVRVVQAAVTNDGSVLVDETSASYTLPFTHHGLYTSNASGNSFVDLFVANQGVMVADGASTVSIEGDLELVAPGAAWDTTAARLEFVTSGDGVHLYRHAGSDLGAVVEGYAGNFAWDALSVASGEALVLEGGALYVGAVELGDGLPHIASISSSENIYYAEDRAENGYLDGQTYALGGGGELIPVPEPSVLMGMMAGVVGLLVLRRK